MSHGILGNRSFQVSPVKFLPRQQGNIVSIVRSKNIFRKAVILVEVEGPHIFEYFFHILSIPAGVPEALLFIYF